MASLQNKQEFSSNICLIFLGLWLFVLQARATDDSFDLEHSVVCQGQRLKIRCNEPYFIDVRGGTYGRTDSGDTVCPYSGHKNDFYFNCGENDISQKLIDLCQMKRKCTFTVGKSLFGDPCRGHAYLEILYKCVKKKRKKDKNSSPNPSMSTTLVTTDPKSTVRTSTSTLTHSNFTTNTVTNTTLLITSTPAQNSSSNVTSLVEGPVVFRKQAETPGIFMSILLWIVYIKGKWPAFSTVFLISIGVSVVVLIFLYLIFLIIQRRRRKHKGLHTANNKDLLLHKLNPTTNLNGDVAKRTSELDPSPVTFPVPISCLPPPPDDMIYPSPSPDMINATRPPPPPAPRGGSLDDISKLGQERNKNVELKRSYSMRTPRSHDIYSKDLNYDKYRGAKLQPIVGCPEIHEVLKSKDQTMYMNPMYENGIREITC